MPVPQKEGPRANRDIRGVREVQLIDQDGQNRGVMPFFDALKVAEEAGLDPSLMVAANTSGGVVGKMISPQSLAIAATAVSHGPLVSKSVV